MDDHCFKTERTRCTILKVTFSYQKVRGIFSTAKALLSLTITAPCLQRQLSTKLVAEITPIIALHIYGAFAYVSSAGQRPHEESFALTGVTGYLASQEIWQPRSIYPKILCMVPYWEIWHPFRVGNSGAPIPKILEKNALHTTYHRKFCMHVCYG